MRVRVRVVDQRLDLGQLRNALVERPRARHHPDEVKLREQPELEPSLERRDHLGGVVRASPPLGGERGGRGRRESLRVRAHEPREDSASAGRSSYIACSLDTTSTAAGMSDNLSLPSTVAATASVTYLRMFTLPSSSRSDALASSVIFVSLRVSAVHFLMEESSLFRSASVGRDGEMLAARARRARGAACGAPRRAAASASSLAMRSASALARSSSSRRLRRRSASAARSRARASSASLAAARAATLPSSPFFDDPLPPRPPCCDPFFLSPLPPPPPPPPLWPPPRPPPLGGIVPRRV